MLEILKEFFLMMNLRKKILEKEAWLGTIREAGDDGVMKMWIEMVSDFLYVNNNKLSSPVNTHFFLLLHPFNYH